MKRKIDVQIWVVLLSGLFTMNLNSAFGQSISKGFQALEMHDYFRSKKIFEKKLKKETSPAAYGLAQMYFRNNNPFHNIDSAHRYIVLAIDSYDQYKPKKQLKLQRFGFVLESLESLRQDVSNEFFHRARQSDTEAAYSQFIADNFWATQVPYAVFLRDSCAFEYAVAEHSSEHMKAFMEKYPVSAFESRAMDLFHRFQFEEETVNGGERDYVEFMNNFPENPYTIEAERAVFNMYEQMNTIKDFEHYISKYPNSIHVDQAWVKLYRLFIRENGLAQLNYFKTLYPNYPFLDQLETEINLLRTQLYAFVQEEQWGFMDHQGQVIIEPQFTFVDDFSQGRAAVYQKGNYGFIDPSGRWVVEPQFSAVLPFHFNMSVVYDDDGNAGLINLFGEWIVKPQYDDIIIVNDEKVWIIQDDQAALFKLKSMQISPKKYDEFLSCPNGLVIVFDGEIYAVINKNEEVLFSYNEEILPFGDLFLVSQNDSMAIVDENNKPILPFDEYTFSGYNKNGLTAFELNGKLGYVNAEGEIHIEPTLDIFPNWNLFANFEAGYAKAYQAKTKKYGLINEQGKWAVTPKYEDLSFYSDLIAVQLSGKWEFVNTLGAKQNLGSFDRAESFKNGLAIVQKDGSQGLINRSGNYILEPEMRSIVFLSEKIVRWVNQDGQLMIGKIDGDVNWSKVCDKIERVNESTIRIISRSEVQYYLIDEERFLSVEK